MVVVVAQVVTARVVMARVVTARVVMARVMMPQVVMARVGVLMAVAVMLGAVTVLQFNRHCTVTQATALHSDGWNQETDSKNDPLSVPSAAGPDHTLITNHHNNNVHEFDWLLWCSTIDKNNELFL